MGKKEKKKLSKKNITIAVLLFLLFALCMVPLAQYTATRNDYTEMDIDDGWDALVLANGEQKEYSDIVISETQFPMLNDGDILTLERMLPDAQVSNPVLCVYSIHCYVTAYLDGEKFYEFGHKSRNEEMLPGYGYLVIPLTENYSGKKLTLVYEVQEDGAFEGLQKPSIMNSTYRSHNIMSRNRINMLISMVLVVVGFLGMIVSASLTIKNQMFVRIFWVSMFGFLVSLWSMCNNDMISIFIMNISEKAYVEYLTFYIMALPFLLYFANRIVVPGLAKWMKIYYWSLIALQVIFFVGVNVLHVLDIMHFPKFVTVNHINLVLTFGAFALLHVAERRLYHKTDWKIAIGFGITVLLALGEMVRFNLQKYVTGFAGNQYISVISLGVLVIVVTLFIDFSQRLSNILYRATRNSVLQQMAYIDDLTGLANRRKCEEWLKSYTNDQGSYAVVNMDMNLLKAMNDTFGHSVGDDALKSFADVLRMVFPDNALICRTGGDEFAVILPNCDEAKTQLLVRGMLEEMERRNEKEEVITLSTAYGCAYSHESDNPYNVYKLADQRMYACKKDMHLARI